MEGFASAARADPRYELARSNFFNILRVLERSFATSVLLAVLTHWLMRAITVNTPVSALQWLSLVVLLVPLGHIYDLLPVWSTSTRRVVFRELSLGTQGLTLVFLATAQLLAFVTPLLPGALANGFDAVAATLALLAREVLDAEPVAAGPGGEPAGILRRWAGTWRRAGREAVAGLANAQKLPWPAAGQSWTLRLLLLAGVSAVIVPHTLRWLLLPGTAVLLVVGILFAMLICPGGGRSR